MKYRKLKKIKELNLSGLARAAKVNAILLTQAVGGYSYSSKYPNLKRKLSDNEQQRLAVALRKLVTSINAVLEE